MLAFSRAVIPVVEELSPADVLAVIRRLHRKHMAVSRLIDALQEARAAGCDLGYLVCRRCAAERIAQQAVRRASKRAA